MIALRPRTNECQKITMIADPVLDLDSQLSLLESFTHQLKKVQLNRCYRCTKSVLMFINFLISGSRQSQHKEPLINQYEETVSGSSIDGVKPGMLIVDKCGTECSSNEKIKELNPRCFIKSYQVQQKLERIIRSNLNYKITFVTPWFFSSIDYREKHLQEMFSRNHHQKGFELLNAFLARGSEYPVLVVLLSECSTISHDFKYQIIEIMTRVTSKLYVICTSTRECAPLIDFMIKARDKDVVEFSAEQDMDKLEEYHHDAKKLMTAYDKKLNELYRQAEAHQKLNGTTDPINKFQLQRKLYEEIFGRNQFLFDENGDLRFDANVQFGDSYTKL